MGGSSQGLGNATERKQLQVYGRRGNSKVSCPTPPPPRPTARGSGIFPLSSHPPAPKPRISYGENPAGKPLPPRSRSPSATWAPRQRQGGSRSREAAGIGGMGDAEAASNPAPGEGALSTAPPALHYLVNYGEKPPCPSSSEKKSPQWMTNDQKEGFYFKSVGETVKARGPLCSTPWPRICQRGVWAPYPLTGPDRWRFNKHTF